MASRSSLEPSRAWDLPQLAALLESVELYEASLETAELQTALLLALDELLQAPEANTLQLQELIQILLQMISFPDRLEVEVVPPATLTTLQSARDWALETLLGIQAGDTRTDGSRTELLQPQELSTSLQQMQSKLFAAAPCRQDDVQMELHQSLLTAVQSAQEETLSDVLEMCAVDIENDAQFLQFAEAALSGTAETMVFKNGFLHRLFHRQYIAQSDERESQRRKRRLFDSLSMTSKIRVWANHLPSWRSQLQTWMLEAHQRPFRPISAVLPGEWWTDEEPRAAFARPIPAVSAACRGYSHLYVTFVEWCRSHVSLFASCRSMEMISTLSQSLRPSVSAAQLFNRRMLSQVPPRSTIWSAPQRAQAFAALSSKLEKLQSSRGVSDVSWQYEWIGVLERPDLLHEAFETLFVGLGGKPTDESAADSVRLRSAQFLGWFYSFTNDASADEITALLAQMASELSALTLPDGAHWLRQNRANCGELPILRLRLAWFWLLRTIAQPDSHLDATTDILESLEYIFRRFTPQSAKRAFQVELVTQLLVEMEWRAANSDADAFSEKLEPLCTWLTKIVRLMQLEEQSAQHADGRRRYRAAVNDVEHLAERLDAFCR